MSPSQTSVNARACSLTCWPTKPTVGLKCQGRRRRFRSFEIGAFIEDRLVAWSYSRGEDTQLHMVNSGVFPGLRRRGIYSRLVEATIAYADSHGFLRIISRHVPSNNAVIIPKLRLGFMVSGFEYSEIYGPLVRLTYLIGHKRRELYRARSMPVVPSSAEPL